MRDVTDELVAGPAIVVGLCYDVETDPTKHCQSCHDDHDEGYYPLDGGSPRLDDGRSVALCCVAWAAWRKAAIDRGDD